MSDRDPPGGEFQGPAASRDPAVAEVTGVRRRERSVVLGFSLVGLGVAIAVGGGAVILGLRAPTASSFLVSPDLPIEVGDAVRLRRGDASCATRVRVVMPDGNLVVHDCGTNGSDLEVPRGMLSIEAYRPGESTPALGDGVIVREGAAFSRAVVVAREPNHRLRVRLGSGGQVLGERVVEERVAFLVDPAGNR